MSTTLLIDVSYLAHRAKHTTGGLSFNGQPTGVIYGILQTLDQLVEQFRPDRFVWAFDSGGPGKRGELLATYKGNRGAKTPEEEELNEQMYVQVFRLRSKILPALGFRNVFWQRGYEADDIIAYVAERLKPDEEGIIVTSDEDLWQCLRSNVVWHSPGKGKTVTEASFKEKWGLPTTMWPDVKALAGCKTDNVEGISGIGEFRAAQWFLGKLKPDSESYKLISENIGVHARNVPLVRLPFPGTSVPALQDDEPSQTERMRIEQELGFRAKRASRETSGMKGFDV